MNEKKATPINDPASQRKRALELLRSGPKSTLQLRRDADILSTSNPKKIARAAFAIAAMGPHCPSVEAIRHLVRAYGMRAVHVALMVQAEYLDMGQDMAALNVASAAANDQEGGFACECHDDLEMPF